MTIQRKNIVTALAQAIQHQRIREAQKGFTTDSAYVYSIVEALSHIMAGESLDIIGEVDYGDEARINSILDSSY